MSFHYSKPIEELIAGLSQSEKESVLTTCRVLIIGSGYGGSIAAFRLAGDSQQNSNFEKDVVVLERGREFLPGQFPNALSDLPAHVQSSSVLAGDSQGNEDALFDIRIGEGMDAVVGNGLGGTSLINANVAVQPDREVFESISWPKNIRTEASRDPHGESDLSKAFDEVTTLLSIAPGDKNDYLAGLDKFKAFSRFADGLKLQHKPADLAVTFGPPGTKKKNSVNVEQPVCTLCGNCVSGCNVGAKNTLATNAIPAAVAKGAEFFTGAKAITIEALSSTGDSSLRWRVAIRPTAKSTRVRCGDTYFFDTANVVIAAGTFGSFELLARSSKQKDLHLSSRLGKNFTGNCDAIAMSYGGVDRVSAIGSENYKASDNLAGPTISTIARGSTSGGEKFTLEDASIPAAAKFIFGELVTTASLAHRIGSGILPGWFKMANGGANKDPTAVHEEALNNSQVFLVMGNDHARGSLAMPCDNAGALTADCRAYPEWSDAKSEADAFATQVGELLGSKKVDKARGRGQYLPNPLWEPFPKGVAEAMDGNFPRGRAVTVHPLGGCSMGDTEASGVVNDRCQVFKPSATGSSSEVYAGLYVMDGSVLPEAVGTNPFLTISALAWRACNSMTSKLGVNMPPSQVASPEPLRIVDRHSSVVRNNELAVVIRERLCGNLPLIEPLNHLNSSADETELPVILELRSLDKSSPNLLGGDGAVDVCARLYRDIVSRSERKRTRQYGAPDSHIIDENLLCEGEGTVTIARRDSVSGLKRWVRACRAVKAFHRRRQSLFKGTGSRFSFKKIISMAHISLMHSNYRVFEYRINLPIGDKANSGKSQSSSTTDLVLVGTKRVAWRTDNPRIWDALLILPLSIHVNEQDTGEVMQLKVDLDYMIEKGFVQCVNNDLPTAISRVAMLGSRFARGLFESSFWEFGAPTYPAKAVEPDTAPPNKLRLDNDRTSSPKEEMSFDVPKFCETTLSELTKHDPGFQSKVADQKLSLTLTLYRNEPSQKQPVLLIHGLAQGSLIYCHDALKQSLAAALYDAGHDVWLLDYRLSNRFDSKVIPYDGWAIDEIGEFDIPLAINFVRDFYGTARKLHIFAHCVGAIATEMAILTGRIGRDDIESLVLNAIHPWLCPSPANKLRAKAGVLFRDVLGDVAWDPVPRPKENTSAAMSALDRVAFSLARLGEKESESDKHGRMTDIANGICDRMTFLYGRMWRHENVQAIHPHWSELVGRAPGAVARHLQYMLLSERVLRRDGENEYLRELQASSVFNWRGIRTLFLHGNESDVFNAQSAARSANRMNKVLNTRHFGVKKTPIFYYRVPNYGHMDVILGDNANDKVFRYLPKFYAGSYDDLQSGDEQIPFSKPRESDDRHFNAKSALVAGPILRRAFIENNSLSLRYWCELPTKNTSEVRKAKINAGQISYNNQEVIEKPDWVEPHLQWIDVSLNPSNYWEANAKAEFVVGDVAVNYSVLKSTVVAKEVLPKPPWLMRMIERQNASISPTFSFLVGSCRYPETPIDQESPEQIFEKIHEFVQSNPVDALFMIGDQIYADATAGFLDPKSWKDMYIDRYRCAFSAPAAASVMRAIPVHFVLDDHEVADNFQGSPVDKSTNNSPLNGKSAQSEMSRIRSMRSGDIDSDQLIYAKKTAYSYMGTGDLGKTSPAPRLWGAISCPKEVSCPVFLADTRCERTRRSPADPYRLMSNEQMTAILDWLTDAQRMAPDLPKFLFSGSILVPQSRDLHKHQSLYLRNDGLVAYREQLRELLTHIASNRIQNVVFVGGDVHFSATAELMLRVNEHEPIRAWQIVASGIYAPIPFINENHNDYAIDNEWHDIEFGQGCRVSYNATLLTGCPSHCVTVEVDKGNLNLQINVSYITGESSAPAEKTTILKL